jgi:glycosyltransferase involved in cell wall biosynthesis
MRVLYDGKIYNIQAAGGVNRYFANLIGRLPPEIVPHLTTCATRAVNFPDHPNLKLYNYRRFRPAGLSYRLEKLFFKTISRMRRYDLAHPTYYTLLSEQELADYHCPVVITVWDMIHELFPQLDPTGRNAAEKRRAVMSAQAVICISENTRNDLLERYRVPEEKVKVTYLASEIDGQLSYGPEPVPSQPYFLYVGLRYFYKNFAGLLTALSKARTKCPEMRLCVVGGAFNSEERTLLASLKLSDNTDYYGQVSDAHLAKLYRCSIALVYPSLYEGFGLPPLEAMSCGTPVIASNRSSIPEVVGDAGVLFNPDSLKDLADILLHLFNDEAERQRLIARGYQRAKLFSWAKTVDQTLEIYRSLSGPQQPASQ